MDLPACAWPHLFFRVLLADLSDSWTERPARNSSGIGVSGGGCTCVRAAAFLVRTHVALVFEQLAHAHGAVLGRYCGFVVGCCQCVAARHAGGLLCLFSFLR